MRIVARLGKAAVWPSKLVENGKLSEVLLSTVHVWVSMDGHVPYTHVGTKRTKQRKRNCKPICTSTIFMRFKFVQFEFIFPFVSRGGHSDDQRRKAGCRTQYGIGSSDWDWHAGFEACITEHTQTTQTTPMPSRRTTTTTIMTTGGTVNGRYRPRPGSLLWKSNVIIVFSAALLFWMAYREGAGQNNKGGSGSLSDDLDLRSGQLVGKTRRSGGRSESDRLVASIRGQLNEDESRKARIVYRLGEISSSSLLEEEGTPQNKALQWLLDEDTRRIKQDDPSLEQRYVLAVLWFATNGDDWKFSAETRWMSGDHECSWVGTTTTGNKVGVLQCNTDNQVTHLHLGTYRLVAVAVAVAAEGTARTLLLCCSLPYFFPRLV